MPGTDLITLFSFPFMQRAVIGGVLLGSLGGILGSFVILRRLSLFGETVGHASLLGVVFGILFQLPPTWSLIAFTVMFGLAVLFLIDRTDLGSDTILSIVLAGAIALGTIGFSFLRGYRGNLLSVLFGDILAINNTDLIILAVVLLLSVMVLAWTLPRQILLTLNPELAKVQGIPTEWYRYLFIIFLSVVIALTIRTVGILLVNAFLVIPAATARLVCHKFIPFLMMAAVIGSTSSVMGMLVSGSFNWPSGPSIVLVQIGAFLSGLCVSRWVLRSP